MPAPGKHRKPIIDAAITHFRQYGYPATGLNDIVMTSGAPKGSLYHYFPEGKPSIAVAAVEEASRRMAQSMREIAEVAKDPRDFLLRYASALAELMRASGYRNGCPMTTVLLELAPADAKVTQAGLNSYSLRLDVIKGVLAEGGYADAQASNLATSWLSALNGALIQARVYRSTRPLDTVAELLAATMPPPLVEGE